MVTILIMMYYDFYETHMQDSVYSLYSYLIFLFKCAYK